MNKIDMLSECKEIVQLSGNECGFYSNMVNYRFTVGAKKVRCISALMRKSIHLITSKSAHTLMTAGLVGRAVHWLYTHSVLYILMRTFASILPV